MRFLADSRRHSRLLQPIALGGAREFYCEPPFDCGRYDLPRLPQPARGSSDMEEMHTCVMQSNMAARVGCSSTRRHRVKGQVAAHEESGTRHCTIDCRSHEPDHSRKETGI